jgi:hypothetical protein
MGGLISILGNPNGDGTIIPYWYKLLREFLNILAISIFHELLAFPPAIVISFSPSLYISYSRKVRSYFEPPLN